MQNLALSTTRDLNYDGRLDLIASSGRGNGNGTFQPRVGYETGVLGATSVVVGDFNGDGKLDVGTGSRSVVDHDDLGRQYWDSIPVLPGDGAGACSPRRPSCWDPCRTSSAWRPAGSSAERSGK